MKTFIRDYLQLNRNRKIYQNPLFIFSVLFLFHLAISMILYTISVKGLFPSLHNGKGVWVFAPDSAGYHDDAVKVVNLLHKKDYYDTLKALNELDSPHEKVIVFFYAIFGSNLISLAPLNALCWALSIIIVRSIAEQVVPDRSKLSLGVALLFGLWPSYLAHTMQLLKDPFYVLGVLLFFYGWSYMFSQPIQIKSVRAAFISATGFLLIGFIRGYILLAFYLITIITTCIFILWNKSQWKSIMPLFLTITILFNIDISLIRKKEMDNLNFKLFVKVKLLDNMSGSSKEQALENAAKKTEWRKTRYLPDFIELQLAKIAEIRNGYAGDKDAGSNIDAHIRFSSSRDIVAYLPRALQIALMAPFPKHWFEEARQVGNISRRIAGLEMTIIYFLIIGTFYSIFIGGFKKRYAIWLLSLGIVLSLLTALSVTNLGILYRMRYVYMLPIIVMGSVGWHNIWSKWKHSSKNS